MCVVDVAASVRHDVVTDEQYILEVVPYYNERWATDKPMTLEELAAALASSRQIGCNVIPAAVREKFAVRIRLNEDMESLPQKRSYRLVREPSYHATNGAPRVKFVLRIVGVDDSCVRLFSPLIQPGDDEVVFDVEVSAQHSVAELAEIAAAEFECRFGLPAGSVMFADED